MLDRGGGPVIAGEEAYDRLHGLDGCAQAPARALRDAALFFEREMAQTWGGDAQWLTTGTRVAGVVADVLREEAADLDADRVAGVLKNLEDAKEEPCPSCGGPMRFCECMDDPFAAVPDVHGLCRTCGCGEDGDGNCPCGCVGAAERTREAFALGAAWALGDDEEAPAALRDRIEQVSAERDRYRTAWKSAVTRAGLAADRAETAEAEVERLRDVLAEVRRAFDLQCPPDDRRPLHVDRGAWMAHSWWNTVLGGILNREAER